jgi:hypothetical protein
LKIDKVNVYKNIPKVIDFKNVTQLRKVKLKSFELKKANIPIFIEENELILSNNMLNVHLPFNELDQKIIERAYEIRKENEMQRILRLDSV